MFYIILIKKINCKLYPTNFNEFVSTYFNLRKKNKIMLVSSKLFIYKYTKKRNFFTILKIHEIIFFLVSEGFDKKMNFDLTFSFIEEGDAFLFENLPKLSDFYVNESSHPGMEELKKKFNESQDSSSMSQFGRSFSSKKSKSFVYVLEVTVVTIDRYFYL